MKTSKISWALLGISTLLLQGCVFPPLISIEHKGSPPAATTDNREVLRRLDAIDHRLAELEQKSQAKQ